MVVTNLANRCRTKGTEHIIRILRSSLSSSPHPLAHFVLLPFFTQRFDLRHPYFSPLPLTYRLYTAERSEQGGRTIQYVPRGQKGSLAAAGRLEPSQKSEGASAGSRALPRRTNKEYFGRIPVVVTHRCLLQ